MPTHHILFGFFISLVWGVNFVVMKIGLDHLSPFLFVTLRFIIVFMLMLPWLRIVKGHMVLIFIVAVCIGGIHFIFVIMGLDMVKKISSIVVVVQMNVPLTLILAHIFLKEKLSYWRGSAIVIAFTGILVITFDPAIVNERIAIVIFLAATLLYSIGAILMRKLKNVGALNIQGWTGVFAVPFLLSLTLVTETGQMEQITSMNMTGWGALFYTAVLSSVVGYGGMNFLLKHHPVTLIAPILLTVPIFASSAAVIVFNEELTPRFFLGAGLTLFGLAIIHIRDWWKKRQMVRELLP